jgi:uracil-DNA glycosylase
MAASRKVAQARLAELQRSMMACARCAALVRCRSRVVPGAGAVGAAVAFVGIAPGRFGGDRTGVPFSGDRSGTLLREMIAAAGLRDVFITNLVRCNPRDARGRNRDPHPVEIDNCRAHLEAELALVRPMIVACLGRIAWRHLAGKTALFDPARGRAARAGEWLLYPMYHPAYVNRGAYPRRKYARDFARLRSALGELRPASQERNEQSRVERGRPEQGIQPSS